MRSSPSAPSLRTCWKLHGVRMGIESNSAEAMEYIRSHLSLDPGGEETPDLKVTIDWHWGERPAGRPDGGAAERVGKSLTQRNGRLLWTRVPGFEGLSMEAGREEDSVAIKSTCWYVPRDPLARMRYLRSSRRLRKTHKTFFKLLYFAAYYPMIWHLERTRGWGLIHASALETKQRALILAGHGGVGKSTLAMALMADPSFRLISDNLILHDEERVYSLPEPIRLDGISMKAIRDAGFQPDASDLPLTAHKKPTYWVEAGKQSEGAPAATIVLLRFTPRPTMRPLDPAETLAHLSAARDLAREVEGYRTVAAFLGMSVAGGSRDPAEPIPLRRFLAKPRAYLLGIGEEEPVAETLSRLREIST